MKVAIIGGKLQGTEALYLARKCGMRSILIDKKENVIGSGLCDEFARYDVCKKEAGLVELLKTVDFILPALENEQAHQALIEMANEYGFRLAFDHQAYAISSSKLRSDGMIRNNHIPAPCYYPGCKSPYIVKPSGESGSTGVRRYETGKQVEAFLDTDGKFGNWVIQEFLEGPSYSIEVIGVPGNYRAYTITEIHMDEVYDCKRVTAPCRITPDQKKGFEEMGRQLAELIQLQGIMDVEVIDDEGVFKVLEIDARIPSQTPTVVYHASGINLLQELADITVYGNFQQPQIDKGKYCSYEHFKITKKGYTAGGEHIMSEAGPLSLKTDFFGADEVLTDYAVGKESWYGTFINWANSHNELETKQAIMLQMIAQYAEKDFEVAV